MSVTVTSVRLIKLSRISFIYVPNAEPSIILEWSEIDFHNPTPSSELTSFFKNIQVIYSLFSGREKIQNDYVTVSDRAYIHFQKFKCYVFLINL